MTTPTARELDGFPRPERVTATTTYTWDDFDRLTRIERPSHTQANTYDAGGIRKRKVGSDGVAVKSFYSGLPPASESESSSGGSSDISYLMGHQLLGFEKDGQFFYFLTDGLTSVRALVNGSGTVVGEVAHDEFGNRILKSGTTTSKTYVGGLGVTDETENTELMYVRQRWYDPGLGRFLSRDILPDLNRYVYASNSPAGNIDVTGLKTEEAMDRMVTGLGRLRDVPSNVAMPRLSRRDILTGIAVVGVTSVAVVAVGSEAAIGAGLLLAGRGAATVGLNLIRAGAAGTAALTGSLAGFSRQRQRGFALLPGDPCPKTTVGQLRPIHSSETLGPRPDLRALTDQELLRSVTSPARSDFIQINMRTGGVVQGNSRAAELIRRSMDPNSTITPSTPIPYLPYHPEDLPGVPPGL